MSDLDSRLAAALGERYTLVRELGRGGMARVFLAEERHPRRRVAIKVLEPDVAASLGAERFLREVELAAGLTHPHILPLHTAGEADGLLYYTMPYAEGQTLRDRLDGTGPLPVAEALHIAREVADALLHAHGTGVVHRDIKPENILLVGGHAVVSDFGIARAISAAGGERLTRTGLLVGTPAYMSPEQAADSHTVDGRSDQYALGCVLYEMLAGQPPFTGPSLESVVRQHLATASLPITTLRPSVPREVERIVARTLEKTPADRYASVAELADALRRAHAAAAADADSGAAARRETSPTAVNRSRVLRVAGATALLVLLAVGGWLATRRAARAEAEIRSIAVLPLANLTGNAEHDYFVDGMHDALIAEVAQIGTLVVISRQSVLRYRRSEASLPAIARELGVDALIEGSVFLAGDSVRITVQLVRAEPERHLWASSFEGSLGGALGLHGQVARAIANAVHAALPPELATRLATTARPIDVAAQDAYLRGLALLGEVELATRPSPELLHAASEQFEAAVAREPEWATAHAKLALALQWRASQLIRAPDTAALHYERAKAAALRSLALDPNEAVAHAVLGSVLYQHERDWAGAGRAYTRAVELDPNSNHWGHALYFATMGRYDEAAAAYQRAEQRHPVSPAVRAQAAFAYRCAGWHDRAAARYEELLERVRHDVGWMLGLAISHLGAGRTEQAVAEMERLVVREDSAAPALGWLGYLYARTGRRDEARALLERAEALAPLAVPPEVYAALGQPERAMQQLGRWAGDAPARFVLDPVRCSPEAETLRQAPRYREALAEMGLEG
jgi:eukaryotic-like serine/threonine-protein kinase